VRQAPHRSDGNGSKNIGLGKVGHDLTCAPNNMTNVNPTMPVKVWCGGCARYPCTAETYRFFSEKGVPTVGQRDCCIHHGVFPSGTDNIFIERNARPRFLSRERDLSPCIDPCERCSYASKEADVFVACASAGAGRIVPRLAQFHCARRDTRHSFIDRNRVLFTIRHVGCAAP
jgi:hypothetical protein